MQNYSRKATGWLIALIVVLVRATCRVVYENDPRKRLKTQKQGYVYCILHGQQLSAIFGREKRTGAMVSWSQDGEILVPSLKIRGIQPYRGSSNKGGRDAFAQMLLHSAAGFPTYFAIDGPKGPRGYVKRGIADFAIQANTCVLVTMALPSRRWILRKAWDRFQIPKPFSKITVAFQEPLYPQKSESSEDFRTRLNMVLNETETNCDPGEAKFSSLKKRTKNA